MKLPTEHVCGVGIVKSSAYGGIGQKLLEKMGWSNGEGLGKDRNGIRDAVKLKTQFHTHGLGHKPEPEWKTHNWTEIYESSLRGITTDDPGSDEEVTPVEGKQPVSNQRRNPEGTKTTADVQELRIYKRLQSKKSGRWGLRRAKLERIKKQEKELRNIKKQKNKKLKGIRKQQT